MYFHGNSSNISSALNYQHRLFAEGYNVLMVEYRGFLANDGKPHEAGVYRDARAYYDYLRNAGVPAQHIVLHSLSLGTGIATELATQVEVAGLILEAPYTTIPAVAKYHYGAWLPEGIFRNRFRSIDKISDVHVPLLVIHSQEDPTIPLSMGQEIFAEANEPKRFLTATGPHMVLVHELPEKILTPTLTFIKEVTA